MLSSVTVPIVGQWIFYCRHPKTIASARIYGYRWNVQVLSSALVQVPCLYIVSFIR